MYELVRLVALLDEETRKPGGKERNLLSNLNRTHTPPATQGGKLQGDPLDRAAGPKDRKDSFTIKHFAGDGEYRVEGKPFFLHLVCVFLVCVPVCVREALGVLQ
jgi:myosin heavy subunit